MVKSRSVKRNEKNARELSESLAQARRVAQFNVEWIFSKLDSGFQSLVGFRILSAGFRIPKPRIPDSTSKKFVDSGIRIPLHGAI